MKFTALLSVVVLAASASAHSTMSFPFPRGSALNPNAAKVDTDCITAPLNGDANNPGCNFKKNAFPCGGYAPDKKVGNVLKAGQVIEVTFWNPNFPKPVPGKPVVKQANGKSLVDNDQARHNGGICEFSLSYDGGKSFKKIGGYNQTCPDIFSAWPVLIPEDAPACDKEPGQCIFSWSWINAVGNREFYQNCADVKIEGTATAPLNRPDITKANLPIFGSKIIQPQGDKIVVASAGGNAVGTGPRAQDVAANENGAFGAGGGSKGSAPAPTPKKGGAGGKPKPKSKGAAPKAAAPKAAAPKAAAPKAAAPKAAAPKDAAPKDAAPKAEAPASDAASAGSSCSNEGAMTCDPAQPTSYLQCVNGKTMLRPAPSGTVCKETGGSATFVRRGLYGHRLGQFANNLGRLITRE